MLKSRGIFMRLNYKLNATAFNIEKKNFIVDHIVFYIYIFFFLSNFPAVL